MFRRHGLAGLGLGETSANTAKLWHREKCFKFLRDFKYCGVFDAYEGGLLGSEMQYYIVFFVLLRTSQKVNAGLHLGSAKSIKMRDLQERRNRRKTIGKLNNRAKTKPSRGRFC